MFNVLVVEDNKNLRELFSATLNSNGYNAFSCGDGMEALDILDKSYVDLIITDIMMPKMDGYELIKSIRNAKIIIPVLMITAKEEYEDMQKGFLAGADDYMVKPINVKEMLLRVSALLRRAKIANEKKLTVGNTSLIYDNFTVYYNNEEHLLPQKEFYLLFKLLSYPNKIFTRQQLMDEIWGMETETDERTINTHINRLRDRFGECKDFEIITIRGLGYKAVKKNE